MDRGTLITKQVPRKTGTIMKRLVSILAASLLLTCTAIAKDVPATEKKIADFEADLGQAMIYKDIATLSKLVGDDWTIQNDSSATDTKAGSSTMCSPGRVSSPASSFTTFTSA
jgi:hypothetical protein